MEMRNVLAGAIAAVLLATPPAPAQDAPASPKPEAAPRRTGPTVPLRVQILFTKLQGERKVASLPYTLVCNADEARVPSRVRMGIEVPVAAKEENAPTRFQYKNVGTNIDCNASPSGDGRYRLNLGIEQSSIYSGPETRTPRADAPTWTPADVAAGGAPLFRTFSTTFSPILRDGETSQYTVATDPVSGEVVKIDVTVTVVK
jgi:hypothetical protein